MNLFQTLTLMIMMLYTSITVAQEAVQSAPLYGSGYLCLMSNASSKPIELINAQFRDLNGQNISATSSTCSKKKGKNNFKTLQPGEGCFVTLYPSFISFPVYCRVEHKGGVGGIVGTLFTYLGQDFATAHATTSTILQPAELQKY